MLMTIIIRVRVKKNVITNDLMNDTNSDNSKKIKNNDTKIYNCYK